MRVFFRNRVDKSPTGVDIDFVHMHKMKDRRNATTEKETMLSPLPGRPGLQAAGRPDA